MSLCIFLISHSAAATAGMQPLLPEVGQSTAVPAATCTTAFVFPCCFATLSLLSSAPLFLPSSLLHILHVASRHSHNEPFMAYYETCHHWGEAILPHNPA